MTQPKTDLAYLRNEKAKAEQKLRSCQHREKILERQMSELNRKERVHRLCTRAGMLESFLVCPGELTDDRPGSPAPPICRNSRAASRGRNRHVCQAFFAHSREPRPAVAYRHAD